MGTRITYSPSAVTVAKAATSAGSAQHQETRRKEGREKEMLQFKTDLQMDAQKARDDSLYQRDLLQAENRIKEKALGGQIDLAKAAEKARTDIIKERAKAELKGTSEFAKDFPEINEAWSSLDEQLEPFLDKLPPSAVKGLQDLEDQFDKVEAFGRMPGNQKAMMIQGLMRQKRRLINRAVNNLAPTAQEKIESKLVNIPGVGWVYEKANGDLSVPNPGVPTDREAMMEQMKELNKRRDKMAGDLRKIRIKQGLVDKPKYNEAQIQEMVNDSLPLNQEQAEANAAEKEKRDPGGRKEAARLAAEKAEEEAAAAPPDGATSASPESPGAPTPTPSDLPPPSFDEFVQNLRATATTAQDREDFETEGVEREGIGGPSFRDKGVELPKKVEGDQGSVGAGREDAGFQEAEAAKEKKAKAGSKKLKADEQQRNRNKIPLALYQAAGDATQALIRDKTIPTAEKNRAVAMLADLVNRGRKDEIVNLLEKLKKGI